MRKIFTRDVFLVAFLALGILLLLLWPCITVTIQPGHRGVFFNRLFGGTRLDRTYGEGLHFFLPWNSITAYDCRMQKADYTVPALARGGLEVVLDITAIWSVERDRAAQLHVIAGQDYKDRMITPAVVSGVRFVIGAFQQENLYDIMLKGNPRAADGKTVQDDTVQHLGDLVLEQARIRMQESIPVHDKGNPAHPLHLIDIQIRRITLPQTLRDAIDAKFVAEQNIFTERYRVLQAYERYKIGYIDSQAIRMNQTIIRDGLTENYLRHEGIAATRDLAASDNAKLVLIGGKDGLPLLLNPDSLEAKETKAGGENGGTGDGDKSAAAKQLIQPPPDGASWGLDYDLLEKSLDQLEKMGAAIFPDETLDRSLPKIEQAGGLATDDDEAADADDDDKETKP